MANSILTPTMVTRKALAILHQKLRFINSIHRDYDSQYARRGAKIGDTLTIRLPNEYSVRTGAVMDVQDTSEISTTLQVATQKGVDVNFTSDDLTLDLDDFSQRILEPAMSVLATNIESDALNMYKEVAQEVSDVGASATVAFALGVNKVLTDALAPASNRTLLLGTQESVDLVSALTALFNPAAQIAKNYRDGQIAAKFMGFDTVYETTVQPLHTTGTDDGTGDYVLNQASVSEGATSVTVQTGAGTWKQGDVFVFDAVYEVHPETKVATSRLKQFVCSADQGTSTTTIAFTPAIYSSGGRQNVDAMPANGVKVNKVESDRATTIGNAADYYISMGYHRDAFAFATADLVMPTGVDFSAREVFDGISMRIVRDYDINNDKFPCRIDVLYGYKAIRPQLACRLGLH